MPPSTDLAHQRRSAPRSTAGPARTRRLRLRVRRGPSTEPGRRLGIRPSFSRHPRPTVHRVGKPDADRAGSGPPRCRRPHQSGHRSPPVHEPEHSQGHTSLTCSQSSVSPTAPNWQRWPVRIWSRADVSLIPRKCPALERTVLARSGRGVRVVGLGPCDQPSGTDGTTMVPSMMAALSASRVAAYSSTKPPDVE